MTFAISARCARTGRFGAAMSTRPMAVGARCPFIAPGVGVVVTMATTDPRLGPLGLNLLKLGYSARRALDEIVASDPKIAWRQLSVIDRDGNAAANTGASNNPWAGAIVRQNMVAMGNNLTSEKTAAAMAAAFEAVPAAELEERLMAALEAGRDAGGQNGGQHSSALLSYDREIYPYADLRVDHHAEPIAELRRLHDMFGPQAPYWYQRPARPDQFPRKAEDWLARGGK